MADARTYNTVRGELFSKAASAIASLDSADRTPGAPIPDLTTAINALRSVATLATELSTLRPQVQISVKAEKRPDWYCAADLVYSALLIVALLWPRTNDFLVARQMSFNFLSGHWWSIGALASAVLADGVLVALLVTILWRSRSRDRVAWQITPTKPGAMAILLLCVLTLVVSFARINTELKLLSPKAAGRPLLEAFYTVTAFEHGNFAKDLDTTGQWIVAWEHFSALLLLIVFFPLLIGRLTSFYKENEFPRKFTATLAADIDTTWILEVVQEGEQISPTQVDGCNSTFEMDGATPMLTSE